eukprot:1776903-Pyramimonas_sp.AAC.1
MGVSSAVFKANGTVLAGCSLATTLVTVLLYLLMVSIADKLPTVLVRSVDDVHAQCLGSSRFVAEQLGGAGRFLAPGYRRLELVLAAHKTHFIASSPELADALNQELKDYGFVRKMYTRSLGTDSHSSKRRVLLTAGA